MSTRQDLRPWADREKTGQQPGKEYEDEYQYEDEVAGLFRRVDVAVRFDPTRVALAVLARKPQAAGRLRFALVSAAVILLGSAGAVAAVRRMPRLGFWLMTLSTQPPRTRAADPPPPERAEPAALAEAPAATDSVPPVAAQAAVDESSRRHVVAGKRRLGVVKRTPRARPARLALNDEPTIETFPVDPLPGLDAVEALAVPSVPAQPPESQLARETRLLKQAYSELHGDEDPAAALDSLDAYLSAHPLGLLRKEASIARVEALMRLRRPKDALAVLRAFPFGEGARDAELRVLRAELTAGHDCESAIRDFSAVSGKVAPAAVLDRALYGRAACEARLGRRDGAAAGFRAYLRQFPDGEFAAEARRQLGEGAK
jgi:TolA-binding protein